MLEAVPRLARENTLSAHNQLFTFFCFVLFCFTGSLSTTQVGPYIAGSATRKEIAGPEGWSNGPSSEGAAAEAAVTMYGMGRPPRSVSSPWPLAPRRDGSGVGLGDRMRGRAAAFPQAVISMRGGHIVKSI